MAETARLWIRFTLYGWALVSAAVLIVVAFSRMFGGGAIIEFGLAAPDDRVIYIGVDVERGLRFTQNVDFSARSYSMNPIAPDGRQVIAVQDGGNVDLFLNELDGAKRQLTHFTNFPSIGAERASRRANLYPSWSPDNSWIAFISSTVKGRLDLYAVHPDGSGMVHLGDRIRVAAPFSPRWVTFDSDFPAAWLVGSLAGLVFLLWLLKGYNRPRSYAG